MLQDNSAANGADVDQDLEDEIDDILSTDTDDTYGDAVPAPVSSRHGPSLTDTLFADLAIPDPVLRGLNDLGFNYCTPIQERTLPVTLRGGDIAGQAQTGTGKTAAFLITIFKELLETDRDHPTAPRAVVVAPTRELALQIAKDAESIGKHCHFRTVAVFGGMDWEKQARVLEGKVDLVVGTPGRMMDYMRKHLLDLRHVQVAVIDEADRMFDMGFVEDIRYILTNCPRDRQTLMFSATLSYDVMQLANRYLHDAVEVKVDPDRVAADTVEQILYHVPEKEKLPLLLGVLEELAPHRCLIFCNTKRAGEWLDFKLYHNGWESQYMSGDVAQKRRMKLVEDFRDGKIEVLVATDVAARGLHVDDVDLVVNYDIPQDAEDYVHRIGRTGRAGQKGRAITLADEALVDRLPAVEKYLGGKIPARVPTADQYLQDLSPSFAATKKLQERSGVRKPPNRNRRR